jgi:hypothetical protein
MLIHRIKQDEVSDSCVFERTTNNKALEIKTLKIARGELAQTKGLHEEAECLARIDQRTQRDKPPEPER